LTKTKTFLMLALLAVGCLLLSGCAATMMGAGTGWSGPVVEDNVLYVGTAGGKLVSYNLESDPRPYAEEWWRFPPTGEPWPGGGEGGGGFGSFLACAPTTTTAIYSSPVVEGGMVYIGAYEGRVYALNSTSRLVGYSFPEESAGEWVYPREGEESIGDIVGSPVVAGGILYVGSADGNLYAIDTATGKLAWDRPLYESGDDIWATPLVDDGVVYIGSFDRNLYALNATDGTMLWAFEAKGAIVATPLIYSDTIYIGSFDREFYAIDASTGKAKVGFTPFHADNWFWGKAVAYDDTIMIGSLDGRIYALDAESGESKWEYETGGSVRGDPALIGDLAIFGSDNGRVYAINASNGQEAWHYPTGEDYFGPIRASLYAGDDEVYVYDTQNSKIFALGAEHGDLLWSVSTLE